MPGLKKLKKGKKFNYGRNRSRVRKQQEKTSKFNVALKVDCQAMKEVWDTRVSLKENMTNMGVAFDANNVVPKISSKQKMVKEMKKKKGLEVDENEVDGVKRKTEVVAKLENEAKFEAKQTFRFTATQVQLITYMMDKHGEDWSAMARDPKNHYQETAAKLRGMAWTTVFYLLDPVCKSIDSKHFRPSRSSSVTKFISIPEHYAVYARERGLIEASEKPDENEEQADEEDVEEDMDEELGEVEAEELEADSEEVDEEADGDL